MLTTIVRGRRRGVLKHSLLERFVDPSEEPLTLSDAKVFLRVDGAEEDGLITRMIVAARESAEHHLQRSLVTQSWRMWFDEYMPSVVLLPMGPVQSLSQIVRYDRTGASHMVDAASYFLNAGREALISDAALVSHQIKIEYQAGYGAANAVPGALAEGLLHHIALMYASRAEADIPDVSKRLYAPYRQERL